MRGTKKAEGEKTRETESEKRKGSTNVLLHLYEKKRTSGERSIVTTH